MARPPSRAERQSRSPGKPRPIRVAAKCGPCFLICKLRLLGIVVQATTFVARLAFIRILPATQSAWDLFRGSLGLSAPRVAQDLTRSVVSRHTGHSAAGMRARAAHVEALERPAVVAMSEHRPGGEKLIERELTVKDVATRQAKLAFQIQWGKRAPRDNACAKAGSVAVHRLEHQLRNLLFDGVP